MGSEVRHTSGLPLLQVELSAWEKWDALTRWRCWAATTEFTHVLRI